MPIGLNTGTSFVSLPSCSCSLATKPTCPVTPLREKNYIFYLWQCKYILVRFLAFPKKIRSLNTVQFCYSKQILFLACRECGYAGFLLLQIESMIQA